jgi:hypothetical protein
MEERKVIIIGSGGTGLSDIKNALINKGLIGSSVEVVEASSKEEFSELMSKNVDPIVIVGADKDSADNVLTFNREKKPIIIGASDFITENSELIDLKTSIRNFPKLELIDSDISNGLRTIQDLNLSKEQISEILHSPNERLEDETQEDYKIRRKLNKLLIKFRGQY